jgi:hypothetical protein
MGKCKKCRLNKNIVCKACKQIKCDDFDCDNCIYKYNEVDEKLICKKCKECSKCEKILTEREFETCDYCDNIICANCWIECSCTERHLFCPCTEPEGQDYSHRTYFEECDQCKRIYVEGCDCSFICKICESRSISKNKINCKNCGFEEYEICFNDFADKIIDELEIIEGDIHKKEDYLILVKNKLEYYNIKYEKSEDLIKYITKYICETDQ